MIINALNSGARVFMADFEDANAPLWPNVVEGQAQRAGRRSAARSPSTPRTDAATGCATRRDAAGATARLAPGRRSTSGSTARRSPRASSISGSTFFHNAKELLARGSGPYFYLPKMESHLEARLWNDVFCAAQDALGIPRGTIRATVLIETILAAFEMEEILYELRDHAAGLNAGRWDYIFSTIKKFRHDRAAMLPDRVQVTMTVPFMRAYTELLVKTCHRRGAHAIGGMAAFIPSRRDPEVNERALTARACRQAARGRRRLRRHVGGASRSRPGGAGSVRRRAGRSPQPEGAAARGGAAQTRRRLLDFRVPGGKITEAGVRNDISVGVQYVESWLRGTGAVAIFNLMEDAATAEIARGQLWQWRTPRRHAGRRARDDGGPLPDAAG